MTIARDLGKGAAVIVVVVVPLVLALLTTIAFGNWGGSNYIEVFAGYVLVAAHIIFVVLVGIALLLGNTQFPRWVVNTARTEAAVALVLTLVVAWRWFSFLALA